MTWTKWKGVCVEWQAIKQWELEEEGGGGGEKEGTTAKVSPSWHVAHWTGKGCLHVTYHVETFTRLSFFTRDSFFFFKSFFSKSAVFFLKRK